MREVMHYQCESCNHIFEDSSVIEKCLGCDTEICSACGILDWQDDGFYCNSCIDEREGK